MRSLPAVVTLVVCAALAPSRAAPSHTDVGRPDVRIDATAAFDALPPLVTWAELVLEPTRYLGREVRLVIALQERIEGWNPYLTRFGEGQFVGFQGWADEQRLWNEDDYATPAVRVFARRGSVAGLALTQMPSFARCELSLVVRETFLDLPWVEVVRARQLAQHVSEATVIHASQAVQEWRAGRHGLADSAFASALAAPLPDAVYAELSELREQCKAEAEAEKAKPGSFRRVGDPR